MLRNILLTGCLYLLIGSSMEVVCQHNSIFFNTKSFFKRAEKHYERASYVYAIEFYQKALDKKPESEEIKLKIANCYRLLNNTKAAQLWYDKIINSSIITPKDKFNYAQVLLANGHYEKSKLWFKKSNPGMGGDSIAYRKIEGIVNLKLFYEDSLTYPYKFLPVNSTYSDFCPVYYSEGIVFTSSRGKNNFIKIKNTRDNSMFLDLYYSKFDEYKNPEKPIKFDVAINTSLHEGPVVFYDHEEKIIITRNDPHKTVDKNKNSVNRLGLYFADKNRNGKWSDVKPFPYNGPGYSVAHPSISKDGRTLYFISDMPGGCGGTDIYVSYNKDSSWSTPVNLGSQINTSANEVFPYLQYDSILYFSSKGYSGLGGLDIYKSVKENNKFGHVENLGYPINSSQDDFGMVFGQDAPLGFFCSNRNKGGNDDDIFSFEIVKILVEGMVKEEGKNNFLEGVTLKLYQNEKEILLKNNNKDGKFYLNLDPGKEYVLTVSKDYYKSVSHTISTKGAKKDDVIKVNIALQKTLKVFVKGVIKMDSNFSGASSLRVFYKEINSSKIDTIYTDQSGGFYTEINPDPTYVFFVEREKQFGKVILKPGKRKKGVYVVYANIHLADYTVAPIRGVVKDSNTVVDNATIIIQNELTGLIDTTYSDAKGFFTFDGVSYCSYRITAIYGNRNIFLEAVTINKDKNKELEMVLPENLPVDEER